MRFSYNKKGFTLVELLVVISIIGLLSSFAVVSLNSARVKARNALRKGDMAQLRTALVLYYDDNAQYPVCVGGGWDTMDPFFGTDPDTGSACYNVDVSNALASGPRPIMPVIPKDPLNENNLTLANGGRDDLIYLYVSDAFGQQYAIVYQLEEEPGVWQYSRGY
ncbi:MAG: prepilin-type N-terminal cleavage/methylation domain-containing protein [Patescibacteria group bacterium]|nr:prepilin-type N-terminal cleavage/methylation domain-containing protein [Patescibacteria group bacterium]